MTVHNVPIPKLKDKDFCQLLVCHELRPCYQTFMNTMFDLSLIVEEKIAAEIKGKRGVIMHDGWSKFARHYVCLLAFYMISIARERRL